MSMNKHPIEQEELMAYLDGELPPNKAKEALSQLELCPDCQNLAADFRGVSQVLMAWEIEPTEEAETGKGQQAKIGNQSNDKPLVLGRSLGRSLGYRMASCRTEAYASHPQSGSLDRVSEHGFDRAIPHAGSRRRDHFGAKRCPRFHIQRCENTGPRLAGL